MSANLKSALLSKGLDLGFVFQPYGLVSGDVLHVIELDSSRVSLFIADVSGKGIPAALIAACISEFIQGPAKEIASPKDAVLALNDRLFGKIPAAMFATAMYAVVDSQKRTLTTVNCGHNPVAIFRNATKKVEEFDIPGTVLGRVPTATLAASLKEGSITLESYDRIMLYTDGLSEAMNPAEVEYGKDRMKTTFAKIARFPSDEFLVSLIHDLEDFQAGAPIGDDLSIITVRASSDLSVGSTPRPQMITPVPQLVEHASTPLPALATREKPYSLVAVDLDRFSELNAKCGPQEGDAAIRKVGEELRSRLEGVAKIERYRGDEYCVIGPSGRGVELADDVLKKIHEVKLPMPLTASAGVAQFPENGTTTERVMRQARMAMELSKQKGGDRTTAVSQVDPLDAIAFAAAAEIAHPVFAGRNEELALVEQTLDEARRGRSRLLVVSGDRGGGKSRLLEEAGKLAEARKMLVVSISCRPEDSTSPYALIHRILSHLAKRWPNRVKMILDSIPVECFHLLREIFPDLAGAHDRPPAQEGSKDRYRLVFVTLSRVFQGWARSKGMCLLIERAHDCDRASLELLRWMLTSPGLRTTTFMEVSRESLSSEGFFATALTEFLKDLRFTGNVWELELAFNALGERDLRTFVRNNLLSIDPWEAFSSKAADATGGDPSRLQQWLRRQLVRASLKPSPLFWKFDPGALVTPEPFTRKDVSDPDSRELLDLAVVFGVTFDSDLLCKALSWERVRFDDVVDRLQTQSVLCRPVHSQELGFLSESTWDSWYSELPAEDRRALHARAARCFEEIGDPFATLFHAERAGDSERAARSRSDAERRAQALFDEKRIQALRNLKASDEMIVIPDCKDTLNEEVQAAVFSMMRKLSNAIKLIRLYPKGSPALEQALALYVEECDMALQSILGVTISIDPKGVSLNQMAPKELAAGTAEESLIQLMKEKLIKSVTLLKGAAKEELLGLSQLLAERSDPYEIAARDDYWQWRSDQLSFSRIGISPVAFVADSGEVSELADDARTLKEIGSSIREFLQALVGGAEAARVYPRGSGVIQENVLTLHRSLTALMKHIPGLSLGVVQQDLAINGTPADATKYTRIVDEVAKFLLDRDIRSISFTGDVDPKELDALMDVLGRSAAKGEEQVSQLLDKAQVQSIAVGANAVRHKEFGVSTGAKIDHGPIEKVMEWLQADDDSLARAETLDQLVQILNAVGAAKRPDLGCRVIKRYVKMLVGGEPTRRLAAAKAVAETILRCTPFVRKVVVATAQDAITALLSSEPEGPVFDALAPLSLRVMQEAIAKSNWEVVRTQLDALLQRDTAKGLVDEALNLMEREHQLDPLFKAFESASERLHIEPILHALGSRIVRPLAMILQRTEDSKTRRAAALLLRKIDVDIWKKVLKGFSSMTASFECLNVIEALPVLMDDLSQAGSTLARLADHTDESVLNRLLDLAEPLGYAAADEIVGKLLWRADEKILLRALQTAARLRLKNSAPTILNMLKREQSLKLSVACCEYFQHVPMTFAQEILMKIASSKKGFLGMQYEFDAEIRAAAVLALGSFKNPEAEAVLKKAREDKSAAVRAAARHALEGDQESEKRA